MISSTEGGIMSAKKKEKKEPIGILAEKDVVAELYWEILRSMPEYYNDYKAYEENGDIQWLCEKWSLLEPLDPFITYKEIDSEYKAYYFFSPKGPRIPVQSKVVSKTPEKLIIEFILDLRCEKDILTEEIERVVHKIVDLNHFQKARENLFGKKNTKSDDDDYKDLLFVFRHSSLKHRTKGPKLPKVTIDKIIELGKKLRGKKNKRIFTEENDVRNKFRALEKLIKDFPVPIKSNP